MPSEVRHDVSVGGVCQEPLIGLIPGGCAFHPDAVAGVRAKESEDLGPYVDDDVVVPRLV